MRELIVNTFATVDGVMQAPGGPEEDPSGGFRYGGWSVGYWDEDMQGVIGELMGRPFDLVLGRRTYEIFAAHWPHAGDAPGAEPLNRAAKHVATRTLSELGWQNSHVIAGEVPDGVRALKAQDGPELQVHGSANLLQTLFAHRLVDELRLWTFPVVLGTGKRLFEAGVPADGLQLAGSRTFSTGVVCATYRPGGEIRGGSFALDPPTEAEAKRRARADA